MPMPSFAVEFDADGAVIDAQQVEAALTGLAAAQATDLLVLSHGWNNDIPEASQLYQDLLAKLDGVLDAAPPAGIAARAFVALEIFWPSKKFDDPALVPGGGGAAVSGGGTDLPAAALLARLDQFAQDPRRLGGQDVDPVRSALVEQAKSLVPTLDQESSQREFVHLLRTLVSPGGDAHPEDGSDAFFTKDPITMLRDLEQAPPAPQLGAGGGGVAGLGNVVSTIGDLFSGARAAARRALNFTTYFQMKQRAGLVGRTGVATVVRQIHQRFPDLRLHLAGHSFGGRLVTAAADALGPDVRPATMTLLQAAYSHNGLAANFDNQGHDGLFRAVAALPKVSGPILITRTKNDQAVGIAYPLASRIAHDVAAALGDQNDPYGGMGRNGAQKTPEAVGNDGFLERLGFAYRFSPHRVYNLTADEFIKNHGDVAKAEVAYAMLCAIATT
jgi:hypothetical protein